MAETMGHVILKDEHLVKLSQRISSERELLELGVNGLKLKDYVIKTALYNKREIQSAVYEVLSSWLKRYESREEAFGLLETALKECNMKSLAEELLEWTANSSASSQTLQERTYTLFFHLWSVSLKICVGCEILVIFDGIQV